MRKPTKTALFRLSVRIISESCLKSALLDDLYDQYLYLLLYSVLSVRPFFRVSVSIKLAPPTGARAVWWQSAVKTFSNPGSTS